MIRLDLYDLKNVIIQLWRAKVIIFLVVLTGVLFGLILSDNIDDTYTYRATSSICVTYTATYQEQVSGSNILVSYSEVATSTRVCEYAASLLNNEITASQIKNSINISINTNSYIMRITVNYSDHISAVQIANAVAEAYVEQIALITGNNSIQILDLATNVVTQPLNEKRNVLLAVSVIAFLLICGWIAGKELFSGKIVDISQCVENENEILTIIPYERKK